MIKNSIYTYDYFQPEEYKFSLDSVFLAQKVAKILQDAPGLEEWTTLDLCAGCGIIGLELSLHQKKLRKMDFLEIQDSYLPYFKKNLEMIYSSSRNEHFLFLNLNYKDLMSKVFENHYDLIVSNPPYFFKGEGLLSPSEFKNRCRFFLDSDFSTLIESILFALKPGRSAYVLVRNGDHHGRRPIEEIKKIIKDLGAAQIIDNVRGTDIVQIEKKLL